MTDLKYMYNVNYSEYEEPLCAIEKRALFGVDLTSKVFYSDRKIDPSVSPFIKNRLEILYKERSLEALIDCIKEKDLGQAPYNVKYIKLFSGDPHAEGRNSLCKQVRNHIQGDIDYSEPKRLYGLTCYRDTWYFGVLCKNSKLWKKHDKRPYTYSNSLKINMAKVLVNLAGQGNVEKRMIDPCCGAGTVLLEGLFAGYAIDGSDISWKTARNARANIEHFGYRADVQKCAIQDIGKTYDSSIIDLPYGLYSQTSPEKQLDIIKHAKRISSRVVIISSEDIAAYLKAAHLKSVDGCAYHKSVNRKFTRFINVCVSCESEKIGV